MELQFTSDVVAELIAAINSNTLRWTLLCRKKTLSRKFNPTQMLPEEVLEKARRILSNE